MVHRNSQKDEFNKSRCDHTLYSFPNSTLINYGNFAILLTLCTNQPYVIGF